MTAHNDRFGQPEEITLGKMASVLNSLDMPQGDGTAFERFALQVQSLSLHKTLG